MYDVAPGDKDKRWVKINNTCPKGHQLYVQQTYALTFGGGEWVDGRKYCADCEVDVKDE